MKARQQVHQAIVPQCAFGLKDPERGKPYQKYTSLEVNRNGMATHLKEGIRCLHGQENIKLWKGHVP